MMTHTCVEFSKKVTQETCYSCPLWDECIYHAPPTFRNNKQGNKARPISLFVITSIILSAFFII